MKILLLDGNSLINRAFYGVHMLNAPDGTPTNAVFGFLNILQKLRDEEHPDGICVAFDVHAPTFRHKQYDKYKGTRKPMPEELRIQMPILKEILTAMGISQIELPGYEADDLLGTGSRVCSEAGCECAVVTGDRDSLQLVSDKTTVLLVKTKGGKTETTHYTPEVFRSEYGFGPIRLIDLKSLMGDTSDNIPGVPGVGEKTAMELLHTFGSLDGIYKALEENPEEERIRPAVRKKLTEGRESAELSFELATIVTDAPAEFNPEALRCGAMDEPALYALFLRLGFLKMIEKYHLHPSVAAHGNGSGTTASGSGGNASGSGGNASGSGGNASNFGSAEADAGSSSGACPPVEFCGTCTSKVLLTDADATAAAAELESEVICVYLSSDGGLLVIHRDIGEDAIGYILDREKFTGDFESAVKTLLCGNSKKIGHNIKNIMHRLIASGASSCCGICSADIPGAGTAAGCGGWCFDTALAAYLLDSTAGSYDIGRLCVTYCGFQLPETGAEQGVQMSLLDEPAEDSAALYGNALSCAAALSCLYDSLSAKLRELNMERLYYDIELPLCAVLAEMEVTGVPVDRSELAQFGTWLDGEIETTKNAVWLSAGEEFNILSPKQLGTVLFEKLMLPAGKKTKTGWSTNADVLEKLRDKHPIIQQVLDYRMLTKLKGTYVEGLLRAIAPDGRIHTEFQMTVTATGRLSSAEPNLQNIPVRRELGARFREMFIAPQGQVLVDADYSQIELRLLAHIADDKHMIRDFLSGADIHRATASQVFGISPEEVTSSERSRAKAVNFGIVYGISAWSLGQDIGVSQKQAKAYMEAYLRYYSGVAKYQKEVAEKAAEVGYVSTLFNRRRAMPELHSANRNIRAFGERVAMNMPIQGTAADVIKLAMVRVHKALAQAGLRAKLILQVHDELIVECPEEEAESVREILINEMRNCVSYSVPLEVDAGIGHSWAEAH